jgi:hypothetical protein
VPRTTPPRKGRPSTLIWAARRVPREQRQRQKPQSRHQRPSPPRHPPPPLHLAATGPGADRLRLRLGHRHLSQRHPHCPNRRSKYRQRRVRKWWLRRFPLMAQLRSRFRNRRVWRIRPGSLGVRLVKGSTERECIFGIWCCVDGYVCDVCCSWYRDGYDNPGGGYWHWCGSRYFGEYCAFRYRELARLAKECFRWTGRGRRGDFVLDG